MKVKARASNYRGEFSVPRWRVWLYDWEVWRAYVAWTVYGFGVLSGAILCAILFSGCSQTNISEYTKELVSSQRAFCAILNAGPYGGGTVAAGSPDTSVQVSASGCNIQGSHVTTVTVPTGNVTVQPAK